MVIIIKMMRVQLGRKHFTALICKHKDWKFNLRTNCVNTTYLAAVN